MYVDDLLNSRDQDFTRFVFISTWSLNCTITVPTRACPQTSVPPSPNRKSMTRPSGRLPPTCSLSRHLHDVSNHHNYNNERDSRCDTPRVHSNFFFFFLWESINDYFTVILWIFDYNKASMTQNESTKRAWDALHLGPLYDFVFKLIINLQIYPLLFNILKTWSSSCSVLCYLSIPILPRVSHRFGFFFPHIFRSRRCVIVCYFRSQRIHWRSTATGTSKPPRHTRRMVGTLIATQVCFFFVLLFYILYNGYLC